MKLFNPDTDQFTTHSDEYRRHDRTIRDFLLKQEANYTKQQVSDRLEQAGTKNYTLLICGITDAIEILETSREYPAIKEFLIEVLKMSA